MTITLAVCAAIGVFMIVTGVGPRPVRVRLTEADRVASLWPVQRGKDHRRDARGAQATVVRVS